MAAGPIFETSARLARVAGAHAREWARPTRAGADPIERIDQAGSGAEAGADSSKAA
jgi:hypothetical protein